MNEKSKVFLSLKLTLTLKKSYEEICRLRIQKNQQLLSGKIPSFLK